MSPTFPLRSPRRALVAPAVSAGSGAAPRRAALALLVLATAACGGGGAAAPVASSPAAPTPPAAPATPAVSDAQAYQLASQHITAAVLRDHVAKLSDDALEGRGPTTRGDLAARAYLVDQLQALGYEPGGADGSWQQPFDLVGVTAQMPKTWSFKRGARSLALSWWDQYVAGSGVQTDRGEVKNAEVVFVGYGITAPEYGWDDFKGVDVRGKVLLILNNDPDWDPAMFAGTSRLYYGRWSYKFESAARQGAAGAIIIHTTPSAGYPFQVVQTSWTGEQFELPASGKPTVTVKGWVTEAAADKLVELAGRKLDALVASARRKDFRPVALGITTSLAFPNTIHRAPTANVWGMLRGSDPTLRDQAVVITAHHDHLGLGKPNAAGDAIYNGALDNASGCAQVLAVAKAFAALPTRPRRTVQIVFVAAEEQGLLGSAYYAAHPTFPAGAIAANVNFDGGNIWGRTKDVTYVGKGKSSLDAIVEELAAEQGRVVKPDPFPDRGTFYRSDQFNFAKIGVPALYLNPGTDFLDQPAGWGAAQIKTYVDRDYHQPSDHLTAAWTFDGMIEDARLGFGVAFRVAQQDAAPTWNPGDEFEGARQAAQRALAH
jgi:Peptidase family M28/PA domain